MLYPDWLCRHESADPNLSGVRILAVDDQLDTLKPVAVALRHHGADVHVAASACGGLAEVQSWQPDVLLSDIAMPEEDGYWLIEHVRSLDGDASRTPAVAISGSAQPEIRHRAIEAGFTHYRAKPVDLDELLSLLGALAGR